MCLICRCAIELDFEQQKSQSKLTGFFVYLERARRFERPTLTLARLCSTPELRPLPWVSPIYNRAAKPASEKFT